MPENETPSKPEFVKDLDPTRYIEQFLAYYNNKNDAWRDAVENIKKWIMEEGKNPAARREVILESIIAFRESYGGTGKPPKEWESKSRQALMWLEGEIQHFQLKN